VSRAWIIEQRIGQTWSPIPGESGNDRRVSRRRLKALRSSGTADAYRSRKYVPSDHYDGRLAEEDMPCILCGGHGIDGGT